MYEDNSRGLEGPERPVVSPETDQRIIADGGTSWADLTGFQRDVLTAIRQLERADETRSGQAIKYELEDQQGEVLHGRLYSNLDELIDAELVVKSAIDGRTNRYTLTESARSMLEESAKRLADACGMQVAATDGGRSE
ncbi:helix-turn-helix transcriptional regulator [Halobacteria archaeon AArc-m2/3/4]|uniref:Helix-turn-helix transcriptional regulator n=1 Tax=Natronoglomus mannanivorans TaxID=2979990 RepID=A0ABT2QM04_9EURY|nr:helix-turn-helix transcriptional regulator [Halobacteria archaeon AArc-m2/3/4]